MQAEGREQGVSLLASFWSDTERDIRLNLLVCMKRIDLQIRPGPVSCLYWLYITYVFSFARENTRKPYTGQLDSYFVRLWRMASDRGSGGRFWAQQNEI